jgi:hypothetical protein
LARLSGPVHCFVVVPAGNNFNGYALARLENADRLLFEDFDAPGPPANLALMVADALVPASSGWMTGHRG